MAFEIIFAKGVRDHSELDSFIAQLVKNIENSKTDRILHRLIFSYIKLVEVNGTRKGKPYVKFLQGDLWELRPGNVRILFSVEGNKIVLLNHFFKTTKKTPQREINKANRMLKRWRDEQR